MKKLLTLVIAVVLGMSALFANPVDVNTAKSLGQKFVQANFEKTMRAGLDLYYTVTSDNGQPCVYVFNIGNEGFVMVAASDNVRPILAYSENGPFDATNPYNGAMFMLETYKNSISYAIEKNINPTPEIAGQWESLNNCGKLSNKRAHTVGPLVQTKWNQNSPYNLYAPPSSAAGAPGGRCYAGCVATAMSQVMKYWDHPAQGEGSHSYYCPGYGQQSANFGATTYQWDLMPRTLSGASQEEIEAVATLMYHCGVSVNMSFAPDGSGAYSQDVPGAMANYFDYDYCVQKQRNSYSLTNWVNLLKAEFDLGRPVYYSGHSSAGGHAFVADGYNEDDFISFNFGWSGSDDDWYAVDAIEYNQSAAAIFNYVPSAVYQNTVQAPTNVTATKAGELAQEATITWTNPTKTMNNQTLTSIDQIVVTREDKVIYTVDNPTPGASMSFVDENVPCYSTFEYRVYAVKDGVNGVFGKTTESFGPTCEWKIVATSSSMQGWKSGYLVAYDGAGNEIDRFTMTSSNPTTYNIQMTLGKVYFGWKAGSENVSLTYKIKDATGAVVCQYEGNSSDIPEGIFYSGNNGCGNTAPSSVPTNLHATTDGDNIVLTWDGTAKDNYGFNIYRDGLLCELAHSNEFVDEAPAIGGHCYQVCVLGEGGESELSNEVCGTAGEGCDAAKNEWYYIQSNGKPAITWEAPDNTEGLEAYFIYRKVNEDGEYERIKIVAPNKTEYKETKSLEFGNWYYYRVVAYYKAIECYSAPAKAMYNNDYFVKIYYSPDGVDESMAQGIEMYPNPVKDMLTVKAEGLSNVVVYNSVGQKVFEQNVDAEETTINTGSFEAGIYMVRIIANGNEVTRKISVVK
ncbi:MAG: C10 family peptidase [Bacteroidales bacterium]|nr:C10 family peptidase [Bacteroidales bacterium]